ncbi:Oidioi.mRNA.OKI2018_I69.chr2.g7286.t1.cds [Oikopleura dioica]|uniref:Oidioi.mRNA.OKI2018_I69.chr2.g7286.t1.cds n=1 Tax=Oikopleura dioica TaxID=34765 RepID=A0ABN7T5P2_OIKDI|nr:Oidioi.mRNA.OKI2018_I69.chr2.g7286.t1.cds [Oikopleura dioica]
MLTNELVLVKQNFSGVELTRFQRDSLERCLHADPSLRYQSAASALSDLNTRGLVVKRDVVEIMLDTLEYYSRDLERQIAAKKVEYERERQRADDINFILLPAQIVENMKYGDSTNTFARHHENVSLYFSDICGFTSLGKRSTPTQVMQMIGKLFKLFDETIAEFNCQKIETIGDAYFAVSGCPAEYEFHASEIAQFALSIRNRYICDFEIPHLPNDRFQMRIGLHTGPVTSAVVGKIMPKWCLFGENVKIVENCETYGVPDQIHLTQAIADILAKAKSQTGLFSNEKARFTIREREITGKGFAKAVKAREILGGKTFFLIKDNFSRGKSYKRTHTNSASSSGGRKTRRSSVFSIGARVTGRITGRVSDKRLSRMSNRRASDARLPTYRATADSVGDIFEDDFRMVECDCIEKVGYLALGFFALKIASWVLSRLWVFGLSKPVDFGKFGDWTVITGGTDGIGAEYARQLAKAGQNIIIVGRNQMKLENMEKEITEATSAKVVLVRADLSKQDETAKAADKLKELAREKQIGVLVNNAGVSYDFPEFFHMIPNSAEKLDQLVNVNCASMVQATAAVIGPMSERKTGLVINIGSGTGDLVCPLLSLYASTKAYVHHFTKCLRYEYEDHGIQVQLISPHLVSSKMSKVRAGLLQPSPKKFVQSALASATRLESTCGYFFHDLQHAFVTNIPAFLQNKLLFSMHEKVRKRAYRKMKTN